MDQKGGRGDARIAAIAARQHGVASIAQLRAAGLSDTAVYKRVRRGLLHRVHRGVYALGHPGLSAEGRWMAAVLACSPSPEGRAVLSHRSAAELWHLLRGQAGPVDVLVPSTSGRRPRRGIALHRSPSLTAAERTRHRGIPVTTPARTIADLRRAVSARELRRAIREAELLGLQLGPEVDADGTRSELERRFLRVCRRHGLPSPEVNVRVADLTVDFLWRRERLVVETDGYRFHRGRVAFEDDRSRDLRLRERGFEVVRLSHRQLDEEPNRVASTIRSLLLLRPGP